MNSNIEFLIALGILLVVWLLIKRWVPEKVYFGVFMILMPIILNAFRDPMSLLLGSMMMVGTVRLVVLLVRQNDKLNELESGQSAA